jgi:hypothetical protein
VKEDSEYLTGQELIKKLIQRATEEITRGYEDLE